MGERMLALSQIGLVYLLPVVLIYTGWVPESARFLVLAVVVGMVVAWLAVHRYSLRAIGMRTDNFWSALDNYVYFTVGGLLGLSAIAVLLGREFSYDVQTIWLVVLVGIVLSVTQELLYRAVLLLRLKQLTHSSILAVLLNALLFAFLHIIYADTALVLPLTFAAGLGFALMYHFYPNLYLVSGSHAVLNVYAILLNFFVIS